MLTIERVTKIYPDGTRALSNVTLEVGDGEIVVLLGTSGCGKTSLLRIVAGLEAATSGHVALDGMRVVEPHASIGLVFQEPRLLPWLDVAANVGFGLRHLTAPDRERRVDIMLTRVELQGQRSKLPRELSGGQQQRAALARSLISEPRLLLLDEPFSALDALTRESLQDHLLDLWHKDAPTILMVTHDIEEAALLGDRIVVLKPSPGRTAEIIANPLSRPRRRDGADVFDLRRRLRLALDEASVSGTEKIAK